MVKYNVGDIFYRQLSEYSSRITGEHYEKFVVQRLSDDGKSWQCHIVGWHRVGTLNKRSGRFRYAGGGTTYKVLSEGEMQRAEFSRKYRTRISDVVNTELKCSNDTLIAVAKLVDYEEDQ